MRRCGKKRWRIRESWRDAGTCEDDEDKLKRQGDAGL
jgi:hypothetical protein